VSGLARCGSRKNFLFLVAQWGKPPKIRLFSVAHDVSVTKEARPPKIRLFLVVHKYLVAQNKPPKIIWATENCRFPVVFINSNHLRYLMFKSSWVKMYFKLLWYV
jgi:hypothetical protein